MPHISDAGGLTCLAILCAVALLLTRKNVFNSGRYYGLVRLFAGAIILAVLITAPVKLLFSQPRPYLVLSHVHILTSSVDPNSFPSGHSATTLSVMTVLFLKAKEYFRRDVLVRCFAVAFSLTIGFSRIYIGMHFPFDVAVGCIIGIASGIIVCRYLKV
ncbi:MAG: phosphatase PAP2 family protein [Methanobrevibacter sp.]|nr:phosphatase PAP2 family protein [Methanobrevibacter sp.]MDO5859823.1 phosphatase PAP2 family protein [Methanobrevibacter sp.]